MNFKVSNAQYAQLDFFWMNETTLSMRSTSEAVILEGFKSYTMFQGCARSISIA